MARTDLAPTEETATRSGRAPQYRVLLHDDDRNSMAFVVVCLMNVFGFAFPDARAVMSEAHATGTALCRIAPRDQATKDRDRLRSHGLTATMEPDGA